MSLQVEVLEKNMAKLTIEVSAEEFEKAIEKAYQKNKGKMSVPGFRKGKVPRKMIEKMYGTGVFYEDAANAIIPEAYTKEIENCDLDIVSQPAIDVVQIESGKPFIFTAEVATKPEVELGEYKGIEVEKKVAEVTDEDVNEAVEAETTKAALTGETSILQGNLIDTSSAVGYWKEMCIEEHQKQRISCTLVE